MISRSIVLWVVLVIVTILASVQIGLRSEGLEDDIRSVERAQEAERDRIRVLRASYAYLTAADQLQPLAERHLALEPIRGDQIMTLADLPRRVPVPVPKATEPGAPPAVAVSPNTISPRNDAPQTVEAPTQRRERLAPPPGTTPNPPWLKAQQKPVLQPVSLPSQKRSSL